MRNCKGNQRKCYVTEASQSQRRLLVREIFLVQFPVDILKEITKTAYKISCVTTLFVTVYLI